VHYLSVCSGIEAASVAWHPLGWRPVAFAEIEPFPSAVLAHRYPGVPNLGDMTKFKEWPDLAIDLLVGGTPCQSFSVAGLRKGLDDPRGNLALTYLAIADRYRPKIVTWENVPGVLSSSGGRDFGAFLGGLGQLGYGWAYRVLDAQFVRTCGFPGAVPQRRRRVFVVGCLGSWQRAAAVLFDGESLRGNPAPRRTAGQGFARGFETGPQGGRLTDLAPTMDARAKDGPIRNQLGVGVMVAAVAPTLNAHFGDKQGLEDQHINGGGACSYVPPVVPQAMSSKWTKGSSGPAGDEVANLIAMTGGVFDVAHSLRGEGFDASEDGTGRGTPLVPIAFSAKDYGADAGGTAPTLRAMNNAASQANGGGQIAIAIQERAVSENPAAGPDGAGFRQDGAAYTLEARTVPQAVAFDLGGREGGAMPEGQHDTASMRAASGGSSRSYVAQEAEELVWAVRRLTPRECERLQGFPDDYTDVPWRRRNWTPDGPRYKALGNSMAVNVMGWLGERIALVEGIE
jgi:DNA (cytosine-5)-methyltransferase 1